MGEKRDSLASRLRLPSRESLRRAWPACRLSNAARGLGQILYGMTVYDMVRDLRKERGNVERLFVVVTFGDLLGVPILPPYYALRLLPYVAPQLNTWKRSMLRERDLTDLCDQEFT
jgi:hypothetical protein